jgi:hypothetical protein
MLTKHYSEGKLMGNYWPSEREIETVARALAAQSTGGVCQVFDTDLEWRGWVNEASELIMPGAGSKEEGEN